MNPHPDSAESITANGHFSVLGVRIHAVQIPDVLQQMERWIAERDRGRYITVTNIHGITEARRDPQFRQALHAAGLCVPDGTPLLWVGRLRHHPLSRRVYGPELMFEFCSATRDKGYRHFFYGGAPGVAEKLVASMQARCPGLQVAGICSPPFRTLTPEEDAAMLAQIHQAAPDVLWVGLGCPKQELWMYQHRDQLRVPVAVGVGQAFDIYAGTTRQAPRWMREHGLEWLFRLFQEPGRLWRRYLVNGATFAVFLVLEAIGLKHFNYSEPATAGATARRTRSS